jgi:pimeloyl-ACP methyl ester carboxylesterase
VEYAVGDLPVHGGGVALLCPLLAGVHDSHEEASYPWPALLVTGRQDSTVGYSRAFELLEGYPRASIAVLDRAGHALPHEQPELLHALVIEWVARVVQDRSRSQ